MSTTKLKELYLASNLKELNEQVDPSGKFRNMKWTASQSHLMDQMFESADTADRIEKDDELAYVLFMRFMEMFGKMTATEKKPYAVLTGIALKKAEEISTRLKSRYQTAKDIEVADTRLKQLEFQDATRNIKNRKESNGVNPVEGVNGYVSPVEQEHDITAEELKLLMDRKSTSFLLIDTRSPSDFSRSHPKHPYSICISNVILQTGVSANTLGQKLANSSPESIELWNRRGRFDLIVLYDWNSEFEQIDPNTPIAVLFDAMTVWDPNTTYKGKIKILQGGYRLFYQMYPSYFSMKTAKETRVTYDRQKLLDLKMSDKQWKKFILPDVLKNEFKSAAQVLKEKLTVLVNGKKNPPADALCPLFKEFGHEIGFNGFVEVILEKIGSSYVTNTGATIAKLVLDVLNSVQGQVGRIPTQHYFHLKLLDFCQIEFENRRSNEKLVKILEEWFPHVDPDLALRKYNLRLFNFFGELYKVKLLSTKVMIYIIKELFIHQTDEDFLCLAVFLLSAGHELQRDIHHHWWKSQSTRPTRCQKSTLPDPTFMNKTFHTLEIVLDGNQSISLSVRSILGDLCQLWKSGCSHDARIALLDRIMNRPPTSTNGGPSTSTAAGLSTSTAAGPSTSTAAGLSTSTAAGLSTSTAAGPSTSTAAGLSTSTAAGPSTSTAADPSTSTAAVPPAPTAAGPPAPTAAGPAAPTAAGPLAPTAAGTSPSTATWQPSTSATGLRTSTAVNPNNSTANRPSSAPAGRLNSTAAAPLNSSAAAPHDSTDGSLPNLPATPSTSSESLKSLNAAIKPSQNTTNIKFMEDYCPGLTYVDPTVKETFQKFKFDSDFDSDWITTKYSRKESFMDFVVELSRQVCAMPLKVNQITAASLIRWLLQEKLIDKEQVSDSVKKVIHFKLPPIAEDLPQAIGSFANFLVELYKHEKDLTWLVQLEGTGKQGKDTGETWTELVTTILSNSNTNAVDDKFIDALFKTETETSNSGATALNPSKINNSPHPQPKHPMAITPVPPNFSASLNQGLHSMKPYDTHPVDNNSQEYRVISELIDQSFNITQINRIINPALWKRFINTRKELLCTKSENLDLLGALGLTDDEIVQRAHIISNFKKSSHVFGKQYSDNMALLFHCTRGKIEDVLSQGLDDRLGNGGTLGKGIYFADDALKSAAYDSNSTFLIFAVLLGDCLDVSQGHTNTPGPLVREPTKTDPQKRNPADLFFDSIVGRPGGSNEFVIYNRHHCCPLYSVTYNRNGGSVSRLRTYVSGMATSAPAHGCRGRAPPFTWSNNGCVSSVQDSSDPSWPFFAKVIFDKMRGDEVEPRFENCFASTKASRAQNLSKNYGKVERSKLEMGSVEVKLKYLRDFGFEDEQLNKELLEIFQYNVEATLDSLLEGAATTEWCSTECSNGKARRNFKENEEIEAEEDSDCSICSTEYSYGSSSWKKLRCNHKVCVDCYKKMEKTGTTMAGIQHTFMKCPFCMTCTGIEIGSCPNGTMNVRETQNRASGYEGYNTFTINYTVTTSPGLNRTAYVPNTPEGRKVIDLLKIAWDRRLCFSVGTSITSGASNVLVWNIHHKTALSGGVASYGYPDPTYFTRVIQELAQHGIN